MGGGGRAATGGNPPPVKLLISPGYTFAMGAGDWLVYAACFAAGAALAWALGKVQGKE